MRRTSVIGWRTTFVDLLALSFVFLILLARPPVPQGAAPVPPPADDRNGLAPAIGMLTSSLRHAIAEGRLPDGGVTGHGRSVSVTLPLRWLDDRQIVARARTVAALAAPYGQASLEIVLVLPERPNDEVYRSLLLMARALPASWLVRVGGERPQLRMTVDLVDG